MIFPGKNKKKGGETATGTEGLNPVAQGPHLGTQRGTGGRQDRPQSDEPQRAQRVVQHGEIHGEMMVSYDGFIIYNWRYRRYRHSGESEFIIIMSGEILVKLKWNVSSGKPTVCELEVFHVFHDAASSWNAQWVMVAVRANPSEKYGWTENIFDPSYGSINI